MWRVGSLGVGRSVDITCGLTQVQAKGNPCAGGGARLDEVRWGLGTIVVCLTALGYLSTTQLELFFLFFFETFSVWSL